MKLISSLAVVFACGDPGSPGPYRIGATTMTIVDPMRKRTLTTEIWYPSNDRRSLPALPSGEGAPTEAVRDAVAAPGSFPLVLFSHGFAASRDQAIFLCEHLASHGYVVAAPDHQFNTGYDLQLSSLFCSWLDRPQDLRIVLMALLQRTATPKDPLFGRIDPNKIAAMGHSLGAYTAMVLGGAEVDPRFAPAERTKGGKKAEPARLNFADARIRAVVALAPLKDPFFTNESVAKLTVPTLLVAGTRDAHTSIRLNAQPIFDAMHGRRYLASIEGATHFNFMDEEILRDAPWIVRLSHRPTIERKDADRLIRGLVLAFFDRHLTGRDRFGRLLNGDGDHLRLSVAGASPNSPILERGKGSAVKRR